MNMVIYYVLRPVSMLDNTLLILLRICYTFFTQTGTEEIYHLEEHVNFKFL